jgi:transposase-like protein
MERDWLEARLATGRSIESIAREVGKSPSTIGYWVQKHGLRSQHAPKHAARGGVERETLRELVERGLSMRQIATEVGLGFASIQYWLKKHELRTQPLHYSRRDADKTRSIFRECPTHGWTD